MRNNFIESGSNRTRDQLPNRAKLLGRLLALGLIVPGASVVLSGCGDESTPAPTGIERTVTDTPPAKTPDETLVNLSPTDTPKPNTETPSPTEVPAYDCKIIDSKYCPTGELVDWKDESLGIDTKLVVFNLPEGTPIYAPFSGQLGGALRGETPLNPDAPVLDILNPDNFDVPTITIVGDFTFAEWINTDFMVVTSVNKGDVIAYSSDSGRNVLEGNLVISMNSFDPTTGLRDEITPLLEAFPHLSE